MVLYMKKSSILFFSICILLMISSCGGRQNMSRILAADVIKNDTLRINLLVKEAWTGGIHTDFRYDKDINELSRKISEVKADNYYLHSEVYQDEYILIRKMSKNDNSVMSYYFIYKYTENEKNRYFFTSMFCRFEKDKKDLLIHFPYYLFKNIEDQIQASFNDGINLGRTYETIGVLDDFRKFYSDLETYSIETKDNKLFVNDGTLIFEFTQENNMVKIECNL